MPQIIGANDIKSRHFNNGYIKVSLLTDAVSDVSNIVSKLISLIKRTPTPIGILAGIVSTITGEMSNVLNTFKEKKRKSRYPCGQVGRFYA